MTNPSEFTSAWEAKAAFKHDLAKFIRPVHTDSLAPKAAGAPRRGKTKRGRR